MVKLPAYPLGQVLDIKQRRKEKAEEKLKEKREALAKEIQKLEEAKAKRDKVKQHHRDKLTQMRNTLDAGTDTDEIQVMKRYLDVVKEKLLVEEEKVKKQQEQVQLAEKEVALAREELRQRSVEVDKMIEHRQYWTKQAMHEALQEEGKTMDEIGNILYESNKRKWG